MQASRLLSLTKLLLDRPGLPGARVRELILPVFSLWMDQDYCHLAYFLTQLLTGHGSFGAYLAEIRKVDTALCPYRGTEDDTPEHTLSVCPEWSPSRRDLEAAFRVPVLWNNILPRAIGDANLWKHLLRFAREVTDEKGCRERQITGVWRPRVPRVRTPSLEDVSTAPPSDGAVSYEIWHGLVPFLDGRLCFYSHS